MIVGVNFLETRTTVARILRTVLVLLTVLLTLVFTGCSKTPDAAPVPPGPPMPPAQAAAARVQVINSDSRLTPLQKQQAVERLQGNYGH
jgi:hypothetical protein